MMTLAALAALDIKPVSFALTGSDITIEWRDTDKWAVKQGAACLNIYGDWEYEGLSSSRTDDFLARCRFDFESAVAVAVLKRRRQT